MATTLVNPGSPTACSDPTEAAGRLLLAALGLVAGLCGCASRPVPLARTEEPATRGVYRPRNFSGDLRLPTSIRRVVVLPVHAGELAPAETCEMLDPIVAEALQNQFRFEVTPMPREEFAKTFSLPDISSADALPPDFFSTIGRKFGAQAILFIDITAYHAYRPLTLGLRAKLALVSDHHIVWSFDEVVSAANPAVVAGMRGFHRQTDLGPVPFDLTFDSLQSPSAFAAYAADAMFRTLPPR